MTSPTNRTDEVRKFVRMALDKWNDGATEDDAIASAITSAVEQERARLGRIAEHRLKCAVEAERERCAKVAEDKYYDASHGRPSMHQQIGMEIATAIRQTPTKEAR